MIFLLLCITYCAFLRLSLIYILAYCLSILALLAFEEDLVLSIYFYVVFIHFCIVVHCICVAFWRSED